jgi:pantoate--beta-alanine ligase
VKHSRYGILHAGTSIPNFMKLVHSIAETRALCRSARSSGARLGLVPTMGALHEGHLSLVKAARAKSDLVAASIFVNPAQFGPSEDFAKYPRALQNDCALFEQAGVELVFVPSVEEMYPKGAVTWVVVEGLSDRLCGKSRPGHFRGVTTVVAKLFHIVEPDVAFFGQKDGAQVAIIQRAVRDLNMPVTIEVCPIVRETDGLAISSRNAYLSPSGRKSALVLYRSLMRIQRLFASGEHDSANLIAAAKQEFAAEPAVRLDYIEVVDPESLEPETVVTRRALAAVAAFVGQTRLIDNILLEP